MRGHAPREKGHPQITQINRQNLCNLWMVLLSNFPGFATHFHHAALDHLCIDAAQAKLLSNF